MDNFALATCAILATGVIILLTLSIMVKYRQRRYLYKKASKFSGPPTLPIIGNAHLFAGSSEDIMDRIIQLGKSYPAPYRLWIGNYLVFVISTPEQLKVILHSPKTIDKGDLFSLVQPWLGTGLLTASDAKWRIHRKLIQPTFSTTILQSFSRIFSAQSVKIVEEMKRHLDGPEFDISEYTTQWALHTTCATTMGVNLGAQTNGNNCYAEMAEKAMACVCRRVVSPWLHPNFIFYRTQLGKDQQKYIKYLHTFTDNVIQQKKKDLLGQIRQPSSPDNEEDIGDSSPRRKVFLDHLMKVSRDGRMLSDQALREEVDTIMVAGTDTTAVEISYVMLMLASHPEVQERIYQELCEIYGDDDGKELQVTPEDLTRMTYLERVIKETLRLFPIAPFIVRTVTEDLDIGEHTFPAGSLVLLSIIELHRNGDIWPDPLKFDPDRFLPEEVKKRNPSTYLPFSGGPRICIGSKYAMMSMKTLLATILRRYVLKKDNVIPADGLRLKWEFIMRPVDPITVRIETRKFQKKSNKNLAKSEVCD